MFASVINWSLNQPFQNAADRDRLMRELVSNAIGPSRQGGVVDIVMIEAEPDLIMGVSLYETLEEAFSAGSSELVAIARAFAARLQLVSRVIGRAYDPPSFDLVDRSDAQRWRDESDAMHASIATWRIDSSLRPPDTLGEFLRDAMADYLPHLRRVGLVDMQVVRLADDVILVVHLFSEPIESNTVYEAAVTATEKLMGGKVEFIKGHTGRAFDVPQLLGTRA